MVATDEKFRNGVKVWGVRWGPTRIEQERTAELSGNRRLGCACAWVTGLFPAFLPANRRGAQGGRGPPG